MNTRRLGATYRCQWKVYNDNNVLVDPSAISITIKDSNGVPKVSEQNMVKLVTGVYQYYYNIPADAALGIWTTTVTATDPSGYKEIESLNFEVIHL